MTETAAVPATAGVALPDRARLAGCSVLLAGCGNIGSEYCSQASELHHLLVGTAPANAAVL